MRNHFRNFKISSARAEPDAGAKFNIKFRAEFFARQSRGRGAEFDSPCSTLYAATKGENKASGKEFNSRSVALGAEFCARRSGERSENFIAEFCARQLKLGLLRSIAKFNRRSKFDKVRTKTSEFCPNEFKFNEQIMSKPQRNGFRVAQAGKFIEFHEGEALKFKKFRAQSVRGVQNVQSAPGAQGLQTAQSMQRGSRRGENFTSKFRDEIYAKAQPSAKFGAGFHAGKNVELAVKFHKAVAAELR